MDNRKIIMAKKKRWVPFSWLPASWGLSGKSRKIAEAEYYYDGDDLEYALLDIDADSQQDYEIKKLELDFQKERIGQVEYEKKLADIKEEPYVNVVSMGIDPENVVQGYFELDWNDEFVKMLQSKGIQGKNDEEIVNKWFNSVCRTVLIQEEADLDYGLQQGGRPDVEYRSSSKN